MRAALKSLSHLDYPLVAHLRVEPEQEDFVDPLDLVFSELRNSACPGFEHAFSIEVCEKTVGFFVLRERAALPEWALPNAMTLHTLCVDRSCQRNGYGKAAIELAARWISRNRPSIGSLMLGVNVRNVTARAVYLESGFRDTGATHYGPSGLQNILKHEIRPGG
ncbi:MULTISPECIES: GNAT family N-acetyltransferase [unclassified Bradyrhizobium]|uniref:GNAT family N-acetyltransferase n=1 Tax=unclassified Bradyrhizobium TaxID=2631580 RepID=UPI001CD21D8D|nr:MULTISPECIES: GNAT family N-acetyltransferase [unclassified Bradyrhizobium]MCA1386112.1 GNAT family N-acetyltransferase [Bradyrhizobium sp. BRP05]MCA1394194.1 GNAT family N-acetyltransferase [Bradyrhizobium sp. IC3123]MCA1423653.1 GNAT family N-acetyltransferase [Bradyrhizobium sp. BRP23]MCA1430665.1 GNAT family N-acetyltransferase [Bradyrhizobium sp. NBAIM16]MCA1480313.1 GNAT family N-acetyltransferase [Bradyrhizobium sp. NBAIM08]